MNVLTTAIEGGLILEPKVFGDTRGFSWKASTKRPARTLSGRTSCSFRTTILVRARACGAACTASCRCVNRASWRGSRRGAFDVAGDIRPRSLTRGRWVRVEISSQNQRQLWIPPRMAHGFLVVSDSADFRYKTTGYYAARAEGYIRWDDPKLGIEWPLLDVAPALSANNAAAPSFVP